MIEKCLDEYKFVQKSGFNRCHEIFRVEAPKSLSLAIQSLTAAVLLSLLYEKRTIHILFTP